MKRVSISMALGVVFVLGSCATSTDVDFVRPGKLMAEMIQERIRLIPYQHKTELLNNLLWLTQAGEQAIPDLAKALDDDTPKVRSSAAWVFGRMGDRRVLQYLQAHRSDPNIIVRLEVARSMLLLGDYAMVPELIAGLDSEMQHVRYLCYDALRTTTGKSFEYDHRTAESADRQSSIALWQDWWQNQSQEWRQKGPRGQLASPQR